uniref:Zinc knuckle CX2CX4HX4C domain-containing protein n=1 Tax=Setaria italica TaxID=4555 RepID=K4AJU3_SETIT
MAAAKLLTVKEFSEASLMWTMRSVWNTARLWIFRGCALMLEEFDGSTAIPSVLPHVVPAWVQIHKVPHLYRTESILKQLASKIGDFHRARVNIEVSRLLLRFVMLTPEGRDIILIQVKYEKIPRFCLHCGLMGHVHLECGTGRGVQELPGFIGTQVWSTSDPKKSVELAQRGEEAEGGVARAHIHGEESGWRRRWDRMMVSGSRKRALEEAGLDKGTDAELSDTATGPIKPMEEKHGRAREVLAKKQLSMTAELSNKVETGVPPPPPKYISPREKKKQKKNSHRVRRRFRTHLWRTLRRRTAGSNELP